MQLPKFYYNNRLTAGIYLFLSLLYLAVCGGLTWLILTNGMATSPWLWWTVLLFFGAGFFVFGLLTFTLGKRFFLSAPRLKLSESGVTDFTQKIGEILWSDIEKAYLRSVGHSTFICLELRSFEKYSVQTSRLSIWLFRTNKRLGFTPVALNLSGVKADYQELLNIINTLAA